MKKVLDMKSPSQVRALQVQRTKHFGELVGRGVIEFRWSDDDGKHMEQGDVDFWKQGNKISLRISKLGELLLWFGGDENQVWMFDLLGEDTTLQIDGERTMFSDIKTALVLLGLVPLPAGELKVENRVVHLTDETNKQWTLHFDETMYRPLEVTVVDGEHTSKSSHLRPIGVELAEVHELNWPVTGGLIDMSSTHGDSDIKIAFESLSSVVSDEPMHKVFDLPYLEKALKPVRIFTAKDD